MCLCVYTDAISFCENQKLVMHGITQSKLKLLRIFIKIEYRNFPHYTIECIEYLELSILLKKRSKMEYADDCRNGSLRWPASENLSLRIPERTFDRITSQ